MTQEQLDAAIDIRGQIDKVETGLEILNEKIARLTASNSKEPVGEIRIEALHWTGYAPHRERYIQFLKIERDYLTRELEGLQQQFKSL